VWGRSSTAQFPFSFVLSSVSCSAMNTRMSFAMSSSFSHCSLVERDGKAPEPVHRHAAFLTDLKSHSFDSSAFKGLVLGSEPFKFCL